jgi:hypothetical protein
MIPGILSISYSPSDLAPDRLSIWQQSSSAIVVPAQRGQIAGGAASGYQAILGLNQSQQKPGGNPGKTPYILYLPG